MKLISDPLQHFDCHKEARHNLQAIYDGFTQTGAALDVGFGPTEDPYLLELGHRLARLRGDVVRAFLKENGDQRQRPTSETGTFRGGVPSKAGDYIKRSALTEEQRQHALGWMPVAIDAIVSTNCFRFSDPSKPGAEFDISRPDISRARANPDEGLILAIRLMDRLGVSKQRALDAIAAAASR